MLVTFPLFAAGLGIVGILSFFHNVAFCFYMFWECLFAPHWDFQIAISYFGIANRRKIINWFSNKFDASVWTLNRLREQQRKEEEERNRQEEEYRRQEAEDAFQAWLRRKQEENRKKRQEEEERKKKEAKEDRVRNTHTHTHTHTHTMALWLSQMVWPDVKNKTFCLYI